MRVLRIADIPNDRGGGMSRTMYNTGDELGALGYDIDYLFREDLKVVGPISLRRFTVPIKLPAIIKGLFRQGKRYDVVEMHEVLGAGYVLKHEITKKLPPLVLFSYGLEERMLIADLSYREQKGLPISFKQRYSPLTVVLQAQYGIRHSNHVICSSAQDVAHLKNKGISYDRLTLHQSGVEDEFLGAGRSLEQGTTERSGILFIGTWILRKGILDLVSAVSEVMKTNYSVQLTIAGCGIDPKIVLSKFAENLRPRVKIIPKLSNNAELIQLYRKNSIFVLPSYFEGSPLVMIEAAALGLAILTTNVCGMVDFIENRVNGLTIPVGNNRLLAEYLLELVEDKPLAQRLGESARVKAQGWTWANAAGKIAEAYQQALNNDLKY